MSFESGFIFFIAIIIFAVTPGPGVFALLAQSISKNAQSCVYLALGMALSDVIYLVLACLGLAAVAVYWEEFFIVIRVVGAVYLFYLAWKMWHQAPVVSEQQKSHTKISRAKLLAQGFLISASNPKVILFYIAFLPTFMDLNALNHQDIVVASLLCLLGLMIGLMLVAYGAQWAKSYFKSERAMQGLNRFAGSIMAAAGVYIVARP